MVGRGETLAEAPETIAYFGRSVRTERWRYTEWDDGKRGIEMYDYSNPAGELENLAEDANHAATRKELSRALHEGWRAALPNRIGIS